MRREYTRYDNYNEKEVVEIIEGVEDLQSKVILDNSFISLIPLYE